ncbi:hypothetical protein MYAM1_000966 [Malassezia yamatoensis]|uniref:HpcH/HpaI aldolase/citrate lyase domain-containing protein n=1 Tax=Malassezia yamatoensis TaxID=253288 RepID=A0AAJ5YT00_9BASI|nr:hypothetical protein MYAM1_000966 [Malassezia yamatoensis]
MLVKSRSVEADALVFDLEDSVAAHRKGAAQSMVLQALRAMPSESPELCVRINAPSTDRTLSKSDLEVLLQSGRLDTIVLPKFEDVEDAVTVAKAAAESSTVTHPLSIIVSVESAFSLVHLKDLLQEAKERLASEFRDVARIDAVLFASEDYCAATGVKRTRSRTGLLYPRAQLVTVAKSMGLKAIDMVCVDYKDLKYLEEECNEGLELGFDGKQAIHPAQLKTIHREFSPSEHDIEEAKAIMEAYDNASRVKNQGAVGLELGDRFIMIDAPMLLQAQRTLAYSKGIAV